MPSWSSRFLNSNPSSSSNTASASTRVTPNQIFDESSEDDDYFTAIPPPHQQDPGNPFGGAFPSPPNPPYRAHHSHSRSLSDKLPTLLGGKRKTTNEEDGASVPSESYAYPHHAPTIQNRGGPSEGEELQKGRCATCDGHVQWPKAMTEYRCSTCLMVNDLKAIPARPAPAPDQAGTRRGQSSTSDGKGMLPFNLQLYRFSPAFSSASQQSAHESPD